MRVEFITEPDALDVVTLAEAKQQMRIPTAITDEDALHESMIEAAVQMVQEMTGRVLAPCDIEIYLDDIDGTIRLPYSPLDITEVAIKDGAGVYTATTEYSSSTRGKTPVVRITGGVPSSGFDRIRIQATAGYDDAPSWAKQAVKLLVAHWDEHRSQTVVPVPAREIPKGVDAIISTHRNTYFV